MLLRRWNVIKNRLLPLLVAAEWVTVICLVGALVVFASVYGSKFLEPRQPVVNTVAATATLASRLEPTATRSHTPSPVPTLPGLPMPITSSPVLVSPSATLSPTHTPLAWRGKIVFTCTPERYNQICLMDADGSHQVRLTNRKANDYYPSLTPDGGSVIYVSNQTGEFEIYTYNLGSGVELPLAEVLGNPTAPEVSPDGMSIVFAAKMPGADSSIWQMRRDGTSIHHLTDTQWNEIDPTWSPDGQQIAFAAARGGYVELFVMNADGSQVRQVTHDVPAIGGRSSWSPDGKRLAFYAGPRGERDIYLVEVVTGLVTRLTQGGNNTGPCFSPDGNWIAFSSSRDGDHEIYIMRTDGTDVIQLTDNSYDDWQPRWGP